MKFVNLLFTILIGVGLLSGCSKKEEPAPPTQTNEEKTETEAVPEAVPETESQNKAASLDGLTYVKGDAVSFEKGKVYVVEFWASWCPPCKASIPHLTEIQKEFKDKGVTVIGISNESVDTVKKFVSKMGQGMDYTVAVDTERKVSTGYMDAYNQRGIPTAFIVDGKGDIVWYGHPLDNLGARLEQIITNQTSAK